MRADRAVRGDNVDQERHEPTPVAEAESVVHAPQKRRGRAVALVLITALLVGGLAVALTTMSGSGDDAAQPEQTDASYATALAQLRAAAGKTRASGTAHVEIEAFLDQNGEELRFSTGDGDIDFENERAAIKLRLTQVAFDQEILTIGETTYLRFSGIDLPPGKRWLSITKTDLGDEALSQLESQSSDPAAGLDYLERVSGKLNVTGIEQMDGDAVTHYTFDMNLRPLYEAMERGGEAIAGKEGTRAIAQLRNATDLSKVPGEAWLDTSGRVRRLRYELTISADGRTGVVTPDVRYTYGTTVVIEAPSPDEVVSITDDPDVFKRFADKTTASNG